MDLREILSKGFSIDHGRRLGSARKFALTGTEFNSLFAKCPMTLLILDVWGYSGKVWNELKSYLAHLRPTAAEGRTWNQSKWLVAGVGSEVLEWETWRIL